MRKQNRFSKEHKSKTPKNLLVILRNEILNGNFRINTTTNGNQKGLIYYKKKNYFVEYDPIKKKIITMLPEKGYDRYKDHI